MNRQLIESDYAADSRGADAWDIFRTVLANGRHCLAYGPPGTGKTYAAMSHALDGREALRVQCHPGMTAYDVLGQVGIVDGSTVFQPGPGTIAVESGWRVIFDEIDRASDETVSLLYALADGKPFTLPDGRVVTPHALLQVVLTTNADAWDIFPAGSGVRDRFVMLHVPEPCAEALDVLPETMRATARNAVRHGITGLRAFFHFHELLTDYGYSDVDALRNIGADGNAATDGNGLAIPSVSARENVIRLISAAVFGTDGPEIVRAWRVAACRNLRESGLSPAPLRETMFDAVHRAAYASGFDAGQSAMEDEHEHGHDTDDCQECSDLWERAHDCGVECARESAHESAHDHDTDSCRECDRMVMSAYDDGYSSCDCDENHAHRDGCSACDSLREDERESVFAEMEDVYAAIVGASADDAAAFTELVRESVES